MRRLPPLRRRRHGAALDRDALRLELRLLVRHLRRAHELSTTSDDAVRRKAGDHNPEMEEKREYGMGAMILAELGVEKIVLLTNSHHSLVALAGYGLSIVGERSID